LGGGVGGMAGSGGGMYGAEPEKASSGSGMRSTGDPSRRCIAGELDPLSESGPPSLLGKDVLTVGGTFTHEEVVRKAARA
jgi:hypothetical protein